MEDSNSVMPSGAYGIPKWIMKKGMRYEVDDFVVSPPSHDDGGFLRLRYGRTSTHEPSLEGAGHDGGMTVEVKDDTLQFSSDTTPTTATISIGPGGLSLESTPTNTPLTTPETKVESSDVHPLLVLPMNFGGEPKFVLKVTPSHSSKTNKESLGSTASAVTKEAAKEGSNSRLESIEEIHNSATLLEKVQSLSIATSPDTSVGSSPVTSPFTTPRTSPTLHRKLMGMKMEPQRKISAHSYFCTKQPEDNPGDLTFNRKHLGITMDAQRKISAPGYHNSMHLQLQENQGDLSGNSNFKKEVISSVHPIQVDESSLPSHALNPKMMGQRRRQPKPSTLREMNFWAPTSM